MLDPTLATQDDVLPLKIARLLERLPNYHKLTDREREVLALAIQGHTGKKVARKLGICEVTVKVHLKGIRYKLKFGRLSEFCYRLLVLATEIKPKTKSKTTANVD
jgi:DNA-binding CsgD family transcriptional regulator